MSKANGTLASKKESSTLVRAIFEPGMLLQHEDLELLNTYTRELSRMMFRSFFGCGVVCGLVVTVDSTNCGTRVNVASGLALDCEGDPLYVPKSQYLPIDEQCDPNIPDTLWVLLCKSMKCCGPRTSMCSPDDEDPKSVCTRERDGYEIRIVKDDPKCVCRCPEPEPGDDQVPARGTSDGPLIMSNVPKRYGDCKCADPNDPCYKRHYDGDCGCKCGDDCSCCGCDCVLLAKLKNNDGDWKVDHNIRRFIRPVLMRDPQVERERTQAAKNVAEEQEVIAKQQNMVRDLKEAIQQRDDLKDAQNELVKELRKRDKRLESLQEELQELRHPEAKESQKNEDDKKAKPAKTTKKQEG